MIRAAVAGPLLVLAASVACAADKPAAAPQTAPGHVGAGKAPIPPPERGAPVPVRAAEAEAPRILWSRSLPDSPAGGVAAGAGAAYAALADGTLRAFRLSDGGELWSAELGDAAQTAPAFAGGTVVVGTVARKLRAFAAADGGRLWEASLSAQAVSDPGAGDTLVALGEGNKTCSAWALADGKSLWRLTAMGDVVGAPWIGEKDAVFGSTAHTLYAVAKLTGEVVRQFVLSGEVYGRPGGEPGSAGRSLSVVGTHDGRLHAVAVTGERPWSVTLRGIVRSTPLLGPDVVYAGTDQGLVYSLDKGDGSIRWRTGVGGPVVERMALLPAGLAVAAGGAITVLDPASGRARYELPAGGLIVGQAMEAGTVVAATTTRRLVAAGVRVPERVEVPRRPPALVSVVVDPTLVSPQLGRGTAVTFSLTEARPLVVDVTDARGRRVKLLVNRDRAWPDTYRFEWDGRTEGGKPVPAGVYRVRVVAGEEEVGVGVEVTGGR